MMISRSTSHGQFSQDQEIAQLVFHPFFRSLGEAQRRLVRTAVALYGEERKQGLRYPDYSFIVFPMAKAYEGFLKEYLFSMRLIDDGVYTDKKFRIGRALNPDISPRNQDENWYYDDLAAVCSPDLARELWNAWLECRNRIFHFFPGKSTELSLQDAGQRLLQLGQAMQHALHCEKERTP